ncbi:MAG TPA: T9SS type A sorting domain-containing protein [Bacteroidales bacterium]|nr:T9SS type A sorting domain-containing protein [Bacteroidales bacterium]
MKKSKFVHVKSLNMNIQRFAELFCTLIFIAVLSIDALGQKSGCCSPAGGYQVGGYAQISPEAFAVPAQITPTPGGTQTVLINTPVTTTTYSVTGATAALVTGLPAGVVFTWASGIITINGIPVVSGTFDYEVIAYGSCGTTTSGGTIVVLTGTEFIISGKTRYAGKALSGTYGNFPSYDSDIYTIGQVIVILKNFPANDELARDTSDASGNFQFDHVTDGIYMLSYDKYTVDSMQWGNGIDAIDITLLKYFIGADSVADPSRCFSAKYKKAGDVDNSTAINAIDISRIKAKIGAPYNVTRNFPKGNWVALDTLVIVAGADLNIALKTICYGDYNASSSRYRDSLVNWSMAKFIPENIIAVSDEYITTGDRTYFEVPLCISSKMDEFSAMGLELSYLADEFRLVSASMPKAGGKNKAVKINPTLEEIIANDNDLLVTDEDGVIRVVYATTSYFDVAAGDEMIRLGFRPVKDMPPGELDFVLAGTGIVGNRYGEENQDARLMMPRVFVQGTIHEDGFEFAAYPNPVSDEATLTYSIPEDGKVKLRIYNVIGGILFELINETQVRGRHSTVFSSKYLPSGMYSVKLDFSGINESGCLILKLIH